MLDTHTHKSVLGAQITLGGRYAEIEAFQRGDVNPRG